LLHKQILLNVGSWNLQHRNLFPTADKSSALDLLMHSVAEGNDIHLIQEFNNTWRDYFDHPDFDFYSIPDCDCGIIFPSAWSRLRRRVAASQRWAAIQLGETAYVSLHLPCNSPGLSPSQTSDLVMQILEDLACTLRSWKNRDHRSKTEPIKHIIIGSDCNLTLKSSIPHITGNQVWERENPHEFRVRHEALVDFLSQFKMRALNTFVSQRSATQPKWTWANTQGSRTQIDYLFISEDVVGESWAEHDSVCITPPDHFLVNGRLCLRDISSNKFRPNIQKSLKGWQPDNKEAQEFFRRRCAALGKRVEAMIGAATARELPIKCSLAYLENQLLDIARATPHSTVNSRRFLLQPADTNEVPTKVQIRNAPSMEERRRLKRRKRHAYRIRKRARSNNALQNFNYNEAIKPPLKRMPDTIIIDGQSSADRNFWLVGAQEYLSIKYSSDTNNHWSQWARLAELDDLTELWELDGYEFEGITPWDFISTRGSLSCGTAVGRDGIPNEVWRQIPSELAAMVREAFNLRIKRQCDVNPTWRYLDYFGLPKEKLVEYFHDLRWICKGATGQKWYLKCLVPYIDRGLPPTGLMSFGFEKYMSCAHVTELIRFALVDADVWGLDLWFSTQDVVTAFDCMDHGKMQCALVGLGLHPALVRAIMVELADLKGRAFIPGAGMTEDFPVWTGGRQGGVETPKLWVALLMFLMGPLIPTWIARSLGYLPRGSTDMLTHLLWADNVFLFANSLENLKTMIVEVTAVIHSAGMDWKPTSLEFLKGAETTSSADQTPLFTFAYDESILPFEEKQEIKALGVLFDRRGDTSASIEHRITCASRLFFIHFQKLGSREASIASRLIAFYKSAPVSAIYGAEGWALNKERCKRLYGWEQARLRQIFHMRRAEQEDHRGFRERTAFLLRRWRRQLGHQGLHHRALWAVFNFAWKLRHPPADALPIYNSLVKFQDVRSREWWSQQAPLLLYSDPLQTQDRWRHRRSGPECASWETPMVLALGERWRTLCTEQTRSQWRNTTIGAIDFLCAHWDLPQRPDPIDKIQAARTLVPRPKGKRKRTINKPPETKHAELPTNDEYQNFYFSITAPFSEREGKSKRLFCSDSQLVVGWINGKTRYLHAGLEQEYLRKMADYLMEGSCQHQFLVPTGWIRWVERGLNLEADYMCNAAMDLGRDLFWHNDEFDFENFDPLECYSLHADGGLRPEIGAFGWSLRHYDQDTNVSTILLLGAKVFEPSDAVTVPFLETRGLEEGLRMLGQCEFHELDLPLVPQYKAIEDWLQFTYKSGR